MNRSKTFTALLLAGATGLIVAGCASSGAKPVPQPKPTLTDIDRAALQASESLARLSEIERSSITRNLPKNPKPGTVPAALEKRVSMQWVGPADAAVEKLATWAGFQFNSYGRAPALPVFVNVDRTNVSIYDLLVDIGQQAGVRADVNLDLNAKKIGFYYAQ